MDVKDRVVKTTNETKIIEANYDKLDIEKLILNDLVNKGIVPTERVQFITDYEYVHDEWGMNPHLTTKFYGAKVVVRRAGDLND